MLKRKNGLRSSDLAKAIGMSVQTIRSYEALGLIPQAERGPQGYRLYTPRHLQALRVARVMIQGFGWQEAQRMMQASSPIILTRTSKYGQERARVLHISEAAGIVSMMGNNFTSCERLLFYARRTTPLRPFVLSCCK